MAKKLITVLGITGTQGGSVANRFLQNADWQIRGVTRNPNSDKAKTWERRGVEMVRGNHDDVDSLKAAFRGSHAIFAVTDWAGNYLRVSGDKTLQDKANAAGRSIEQYAGDLEKRQGITIAEAASDSTILSTLQRFVFSTLADVTRISSGKYTHAYEFDSKAAVEEHIRTSLPALRDRLSTVTMGVFQETWRDIPAFRPHKMDDGTFEYVSLRTAGEHRAIPEVTATRDTGAFVEALVLHHPAGTDVLGASEMLTREEYAALWGRTVGVTARVREVERDEFVKFVPEGMEDILVDCLGFFREFGYAGGNPRVKMPTELGIKTTSLDEYFRGEDWTDVLEGNI